MFKKVNPKKNYAEMEKEILDFWDKEKIFEKSVESKPEDKVYSFYDGPPFITGNPHYGTLLSSVVKDCIPRYWTMRGFRVERRWGWDCHGLPAENMVEKKLGTKSKREIEEEVGIEKFNQTCLIETSKIAGEWKNIINRIGRWVEFEGAYKTMDDSYMESVWWAFSQLNEKNLIYEDVRVSLYCPRCSTPLSNFEIAMDNSYQEDKDPSVYVKLKLEDQKNKFLLAWTTTPWTLPANVALAVNQRHDYVEVKIKQQNQENIKSKPAIFFNSDEVYIVAKDLLKSLDAEYEVLKTFKGVELVGKKYKPLFKHSIKNGYRIIKADFVGIEEGTGVVHLAPAFGEDDFNARKSNDLPIILNVDEEGRFIDGKWQGELVWEANLKIIGWLKENNLLYRKENITHSYPHCHRCGTKLIYKAQPAWFVDIQKIKKDLIEANKDVNWKPEHLKEGRFGKGLETAPDWNISRDRYWGTAMPVWKCGGQVKSQKSIKSESQEEEKTESQKESQGCGHVKIIGSFSELEKLSGKKVDNYHRPWIDEVTIKCEKCGQEMHRIPQVFDCWVESGSMSFAQFHYPFENKEKFEKSFPADFISEYIAQTRAWFYVMHVMAVAVFGKKAYKNVLTTGVIAGEDGRKMSKSFGNYTDPNEVLETYSADALRFYLLSSPLLNAQNLNFSTETVADIQRRILGTLWNSYAFFVLYADVDKWQPGKNKIEKVLEQGNILDKWLLSELHQLIKEVKQGFEKYSIIKPAKKIEKFIDDLSNWYIRRSRKRFWKSEDDDDKALAYTTLHYVLVELSKIMAPYTPFIAEEIYKNLTEKESVHLCDFPVSEEGFVDEKLNEKMKKTRDIITEALQIRAKNGVKVRQPLSLLSIKYQVSSDELAEIIKDELNVKEIEFDKNQKEVIVLNMDITKDLKQEGQAREIIRFIQAMRREADYQVDDRIEVDIQGMQEVIEKFGKDIQKEVLAKKLDSDLIKKADLQKEFSIDGEELKISIKK
jgi:isoleucyl-tRNA synthetase